MDMLAPLIDVSQVIHNFIVDLLFQDIVDESLLPVVQRYGILTLMKLVSL